MPMDPTVVQEDVIEKSGFGGHDIVVSTQHEASSDVDGNAEFDIHKDYDLWLAKRVYTKLIELYPGHLWAVQSDCKQHIIKIGLPILMGVKWWYCINLRQTELSDRVIMIGGGEILEMYRQKRGRIDVGAFLDAREKHSALLVPSRKPPR